MKKAPGTKATKINSLRKASGAAFGPTHILGNSVEEASLRIFNIHLPCEALRDYFLRRQSLTPIVEFTSLELCP